VKLTPKKLFSTYAVVDRLQAAIKTPRNRALW